MASAELLAAAMRLLSSGAWQQAEGVAQAAVQDDPADPQAALLLGLSIAAMGDTGRAAVALNHAADLRPEADHPSMHGAGPDAASIASPARRQAVPCLPAASPA